jgi:hydrazine synthase alpha subunit-like protein/WD40 repeat protein
MNGPIVCLIIGGFNAVALVSPASAGLEELKGKFLTGPMAHVQEIVFAVRKPGPDGHWYANISYYAQNENDMTYVPGGRLCKVNIRTGKVTTLIDDPKGGVRDPVVHYNGQTILFSWRKGESKHYHLYRINADGTDLRQLTDGGFDDFEPCFLPDGGIMFVSTRCKRWVNCWLTQVAVLTRCDSDGNNIRMISSNLEHDNTPWVLPDGRVLYQRWEYVDRSQVHYHHLWTTNPDGTGQMVYYGNQHPGIVMIDAKPIPHTDKVVALFSPGHGRREHAGAVVVIDPSAGPDNHSCVRTIDAQDNFRDPWPFSEQAFMVARSAEILLMDGQGQVATLHRLSAADTEAGYQVHEPRPIITHRRERVIPQRIDPDQGTGQLILANVYAGRNMADVEPGEIKKLLVIESLPKPINYTGGMDPLSYGGTFTLERIVGTVPIEPDGSAYFDLPALRSFFFVALDQNDLSVKRMQSFLTVQPGEVTSCVGCHEQRTRSILPDHNLMALNRESSRIEPIEDCPDVFDYPRDIQPILNALCVDCHGYDKTDRGGPYAGRLILTGDRGPMFSHSYYMMTVAKLFSDGRNQPQSNYPPRALGSSASRILKMLDGAHYNVKASAHQKSMLRLWIEVGAPYPGTYAALGTGMIGGYAANQPVNVDWKWPATEAGGRVIERRCAPCHHKDNNRQLPLALSDERGVSFWQPSMQDPRLKFSRHLVFNLTRPDQSLLLLAPLARSAGGFGSCKKGDQSADIFVDRGDPDYRKLLAMVTAGKQNLETIKRFDMPGFQPRRAYIREMKRYGVLPGNLPADTQIDPYQVDHDYWRSLWYQRERR